ncbi:2-phosphosulfolactate phosphatase family protein [Paenibacillus elgii]|uniref:2-phosphosulfolactate phosphatase n=1 Tax=Paenibacillus elgii TaxID=189691 RepID=UPI002D7E04FB|nr:2-phosphosulfolactate phosphatase family protein [Paenibacillus elgii]
MNIQVIASINEARSDDLQHKTVIVIDVLRATSTMLTALAGGCRTLVPVETVSQAKSLQSPGTLLGGERSCKKIPGFDFGNSPLEYTPEAVSGKTLIMTTTNGTRAIHKARKADHVLIGAFLNAGACARKAASLDQEIVLVCSGAQDVFSLEDGLCAGLLVHELLQLSGCDPDSPAAAQTVGDFGLAMLHAYRQVQDRLTEMLLSCAGGRRLTKLGFRDDVTYCSQIDLLPLAPVVRAGKLEPEQASASF